jgi:two-component system NtrC family response regulator
VVIARSKVMREIVTRLDLIKDKDMTVLLTGETGTGKDLLSEYIHRTSQRGDHPFVAINCAAIPEMLLESELFGVRRGSFTGATRDKEGLIEGAEGGTVYFNEIGEIPVSIQVKLLEILDAKLLRRLGDNRVKRLDVRFIAATNQDLKSKLASGEFREDLYFRLHKFPVHLPPLRQRREDIPHLVRHFLRFHGIAENTLKKAVMDELTDSLCNYAWPGNVRELESVMGRAVALWNGNGSRGFVRHVQSLVGENPSVNMDRDTILQAMERNHGNKAGAARFLRVPVSTLRYHLQKLDLD